MPRGDSVAALPSAWLTPTSLWPWAAVLKVDKIAQLGRNRTGNGLRPKRADVDASGLAPQVPG